MHAMVRLGRSIPIPLGLLLCCLAHGQVRIDPPTQEIPFNDSITYQVLGVPQGVQISVSINYPAGGRRDWLTASRSGNVITVTTIQATIINFKTGVYIGYLDVNVAGIVTKRALVVLNRIRDEVRFRFRQPGQTLNFDKLSISDSSRSVNLLLDYMGNSGNSEAKDFKIITQANEPGPTWLDVNPKQGTTLAAVTLTLNPVGLASRSDPYTGTVLVYEASQPDNQTALTVNFTVTNGPAGKPLTSGKSEPFLLTGPIVGNGENGYWIDVPDGSAELEIQATSNLPVKIYARRNQDVRPGVSGIDADAATPQPALQASLGVDAPNLQAGRYYIAIEIVGAGVASGYIAAQVSSVSNHSNPVMSQIATGGDWKTTVVLVNTSDSPSAFALRFRDDNGADWPVSLLRLGPTQADLGNVSNLSDTIPPGGMFTYQTREQPQAQIRSGYAELVTGTGIKGQAIFQQTNPGGFDYEAAVPMSAGSKHFLLAFDNVTADGIATNTATALVNQNQGSGTQITARVRDEQGQLLDTRQISLSAGQHRADMLLGLLGSSVSGKRGTVEFESDGSDIAALGLRFRGPFTSFGVVPAGGAQPNPTNPVIAQIALGADWKTRVLLVNTTNTAQSFTLRFRQSGGAGADWLVALDRIGPNPATLPAASTISDTIPPFSVFTYQTRPQPNVAVGFAELTAGLGIQGQAIFQQTLTNGPVYEAASPMEIGGKRFILPFDNLIAANRPTTTSMAIVNPTTSSASVQVQIRDESGQSLGTQAFTLNPGEHYADTLAGMLGAMVNAKRGTAEFTITGPSINALGLRFRGPFTSFAIIPK
jgi:hypothetical protein